MSKSVPRQVIVEGKPKEPWSWYTAMQNQVEGRQAAREADTPTEGLADSGTCEEDDLLCMHNYGPPASSWGSEKTETEQPARVIQPPRQSNANSKEKQVELSA